MNNVILIGRTTKEPELRYTSNGNAVANFTLAVDRPFKNQQGERETDFIRVTVWRRLAEAMVENLYKGRLVAVKGRLQVENYIDNEGVNKQSTEVVADTIKFLEWKEKFELPDEGVF